MDDKSTEFEIQILLDEYKARRNEIDLTLNTAFATSNLCLVGIGAFLSVASFIYDNKLTGIFAIFAIVFFAITWTQLRLLIQVYNLSNYIIEVISPEIRLLLKQNTSGKEKNFNSILSWELEGRGKSHTNVYWALPIEAARYGIPLFAAMISFIAFLLTFDKSGFIDFFNFSAIIINLVLFIYSSFAIVKVRQLLRSGISNSPRSNS